MKFKRLLSAIDSHAAGSPERIVVSGMPPIPGNTMLEKMKYVQ